MAKSALVTGTDGIAVTAHHLATEAAVDMLRSGGNAVDAAVAANAVMGVVEPQTCGIGGDLFALLHRPGWPAPKALNASGRAGSGADPDGVRAAGHTRVPFDHPQAVTAPGCVDGWSQMLDRFGTRDLSTVLATAVELATDGFAVSDELARALGHRADVLRSQPSAAEMFVDGASPPPGTRISRPMLAATLRNISKRGPDALYRGPVAAAIAEATALSIDDLAAVEANWVEPIGIDVFGMTGWTIPPNSQGYLTLAACWLLEQLAPVGDADILHLVVEAYRAVAWERDDLVADPDHLPLPADQLLDRDRLARRLDDISPSRTSSWPALEPAPGGTTYLTVLDREGLGVSLIQSNYTGLGGGITAGATGIFLQNRGAGFDLRQGHANELGPGKRPLHTLAPTLWTRPDHSLGLLLGTRGGSQQPQILANVLANRYVAGKNVAESMDAPRWTLDDFGPGEHSSLRVESTLDPATVEELSSRGHLVTLAGSSESGWGPVAMIEVSEDGTRTGVADRRVATATAADL